MTRGEKILGWLYYVFQLVFLGVIVVVINYLLQSPLRDGQLNFLVFAINFIAVTVIFRKFLLRNLQVTIDSFFRTLRSAGLCFVLYYLCSILVGILIILVKPDFANANDSTIADMLQQDQLLMGIGTVILVPIVEETLYRGLLFGTIYQRNKFLGYFVSILVFALIHIVGYIGTYDLTSFALSLLQYLPAGFFLAWAYVRADSIWAPIIMHMTINQIGILAVG